MATSMAVPGRVLRHVTARRPQRSPTPGPGWPQQDRGVPVRNRNRARPRAGAHHIRRGRRWRWRRPTARRQRTARRSPGAVPVNRSARGRGTVPRGWSSNGPTGLASPTSPPVVSLCLPGCFGPVLRRHTEAASVHALQGLNAVPAMSPRPSPGDHHHHPSIAMLSDLCRPAASGCPCVPRRARLRFLREPPLVAWA